MTRDIKAGETIRCECTDCCREWDITLEPKAASVPESQRPTDSAAPDYCPFCGEFTVKEAV